MNYWEDDYVMGHLLVAARASGKSTLDVDLLTAEANPPELLTPPVLGCIKAYCADFSSFLSRSGADPSFVSSAKMTIQYELNQIRPHATAKHLTESPFQCEVCIIDDHGKLHSGLVSGWWYPESSTGGIRSFWSKFIAWFRRP